MAKLFPGAESVERDGAAGITARSRHIRHPATITSHAIKTAGHILFHWSSQRVSFPVPHKSGIGRTVRVGALVVFYWIEAIGALAALITTLGWVPQVVKLARERKADNISLIATGSIAAGVALWAVYGVLIGSWPVIVANVLTLMFVGAIVVMKLRFG